MSTKVWAFCLFMVLSFTGSSVAAQDTQKPDSPPPVDEQPPPITGQRPGVQDESFLFLTGGVIRSNGMPLEEPVRVELVCEGKVREQAFSSLEGGFTIKIGEGGSLGISDASVGFDPTGALGGGRATMSDRDFGAASGRQFRRFNLNGCEIRLQPKAGYFSNTIQLGSRGVFDDPEVGVILLHSLAEDEGTTISVTTLAAPSKAADSFKEAQKELAKKKANYTKAQKELEKAVSIYPEFTEAWDLLGSTRLARNDLDGAREAFEKAIDADPRFMRPYLSLARMELAESRWSEAAGYTQKLKDLNTRIPEAFYFDGLANFYLGRHTVSQGSFMNLKELGHLDQFPRSYLHLGILHTQQGDIVTAAQDFQQFLELIPPDQVSKQQREKIEMQLDVWRKQGLIGESP